MNTPGPCGNGHDLAVHGRIRRRRNGARNLTEQWQCAACVNNNRADVARRRHQLVTLLPDNPDETVAVFDHVVLARLLDGQHVGVRRHERPMYLRLLVDVYEWAPLAAGALLQLSGTVTRRLTDDAADVDAGWAA